MKAKVIRKSFPKIRVLIRAGKPLYQVDARRQGTTGRREHFSTRKEAEDRANEIAGDFDRLGQEGLSFPNELRVMALHCAQQIEPYGKTIADATSHFIAHLEAERKRMESRKIPPRLKRFRAACGFKTNRKNPDGPRWDEDVLRHCYASYWLAKHKDRPHLAENMGNSLKMIKDHYKRIVPKSEVEKFWGILPGGAKSEEKKLEEDVLASAA